MSPNPIAKVTSTNAANPMSLNVLMRSSSFLMGSPTSIGRSSAILPQATVGMNCERSDLWTAIETLVFLPPA